MKYGINLLLWTLEVDESHAALLDQIRRWGYHGVELPLFSFEEATYARIGRRLDELNLERTAVTVCTEAENPISADATVRQAGVNRLRRALDMCAVAGVRLLCGPLHSGLGVFTGRGPTADEWRWGVDSLSMIADYAETLHVSLALEPLNRFECYFLNSSEDGLRFVQDVNHSHLRIMVDTFHAHIEEKDPGAAIRGCGRQLAHVHISENDRSTPGAGSVPWNSIVSALRHVQYDGWLMVEAFGMAMPELAAATKIWRKMFADESQLAQDAIRFLQRNWPISS